MSIRSIWFSISFYVLCACQPEVTYDVGTITPGTEGEKTELKDDLQFMSIAYRDLYDEEVPPSVLKTMRKAYLSFGDKELIVDEVVQSLLLSPDLELPTQQSIASDPAAFIAETYKKFLLRNPTSFESEFWKTQLDQHPDLTAQEIYYTFMTCQEYKYY